MNCIGIIAAFPAELKALVRGWQPVDIPAGRKGDLAWRGRIDQMECVAVAAGMGREAAARACSLLEQAVTSDEKLSGLVSLGWAGATSCGVAPGEAYRIAEVVDASTEERFKTDFPPDPALRLKLATVDHVVQPAEKRQIAERFRTVFVDMEAAEVARTAQRKSVPFFCIKAVTDAQNEIFPDFGAYTDAEGKLMMPALLGHVAMRPKYWRALARMGKNGKIGAEALAIAMRDFLGEQGNADNGRSR